MVAEVDGEEERIDASIGLLFPVIGDEPTPGFGGFTIHSDPESKEFVMYLPPGEYDLFAGEQDGEDDFEISPRGQRVKLMAGQQKEVTFTATPRDQ